MNEPEKWEAVHDADGDYAIFSGRELVAVTTSDTPEDERKAKLIAAAPELAQALEGLLHQAKEIIGYVPCTCVWVWPKPKPDSFTHGESCAAAAHRQAIEQGGLALTKAGRP